MSPSHYLVTSSRIRMIYAFCIFNSRKLLYKNVSFLWKAGNVGGGELRPGMDFLFEWHKSTEDST